MTPKFQIGSKVSVPTDNKLFKGTVLGSCFDGTRVLYEIVGSAIGGSTQYLYDIPESLLAADGEPPSTRGRIIDNYQYPALKAFEHSPNIHTLNALDNLTVARGQAMCSVGLPNGQWLPARPEGFFGLRHRIRCAWLVFTGRADAVVWPGGQ